MTPEKMEFDWMLDDFSPWFVKWWGTGVLPIDADLLPPAVPNYRTSARLLSAQMHPRLTNDEHTKMLKLAKAHQTHLSKNLQGLANAILKLWEKSLVAKIAVKLGVQNTNNELMALELKVSSQFECFRFLIKMRHRYYTALCLEKGYFCSTQFQASTVLGIFLFSLSAILTVFFWAFLCRIICGIV
ncbi:hypothetical protein P8452_46597 [Trifolium repens]|nr:hypothetical protein P8452_46597 [Trifolium repens]